MVNEDYRLGILYPKSVLCGAEMLLKMPKGPAYSEIRKNLKSATFSVPGILDKGVSTCIGKN